MNASRITPALLALAACSLAQAQVHHYSIRELAGPVGPASPFAINGSGTVAGFAQDAGASFHAAQWSASSALAPAAPGFTQTITTCLDNSGRSIAQAYSMGVLTSKSFAWDVASFVPLGDFAARACNNSGAIVGLAPITTSNVHFSIACVYASGSLTLLPSLGGPSSQALGVSQSGVIVGSSHLATGLFPHACAWIGGQCIDLGTLGGTNSQALAINDVGGVVGTAAIASGVLHPFKFIINGAGVVTQRIDLGVITPGSSGTAMGVNNAGDVVGVSNWTACLWSDGTIVDLNSLLSPSVDWRLDVASAISDQGVIAGWGMHQGQYRGFVLMPSCPADLDNGSGTGTPDLAVDINDLLYFLVEFEAGNAVVDLDNGSGQGIPDGGVDVNDLLYFLIRFEVGC